MDSIKLYWNDRDPKEQLIIGALAIACVVVLLWIIIYMPISKWRATEQAQASAQANNLTEVSLLAGQLKARNNGESQQESAELTEIVDRSLRNNSIKMRNINPGKDSTVRVTLEDTTYEPLIQWLYDLEYKEQVQVLDIKIRQNSSGLLSVNNILLRKP